MGQVALAAPVVFAVGLVFTLLLMPLMGVRLSDIGKLAGPPWWSYLGGLCGAVFILAMLSQTQKLGSGESVIEVAGLCGECAEFAGGNGIQG